VTAPLTGGAAAPPLGVSVVVPTRDTRALTLRCLESLHAGDAPAPDVVVVDDGSADGTAEAVQTRWPAVRVLRLPSPRGFTVAANTGLGAARGDLLVLLNSDTEVAPGALARLGAPFAVRPRLGIAGAELRFPDGRPQWSGGRLPTAAWLFAQASGLAGALGRVPGYRRVYPLEAGARTAVDWVTGAAMAIRRAAWAAVGPLDERFRAYCQDLDLCQRAAAAGWEVALVPGALVVHHGGATISRLSGALTSRQHPELLWTDLLRWVAKSRGPAAARVAARAIRLGGALRIGARGILGPVVPASRRAAWRQDTRAFARALAAVGTFDPDLFARRGDPTPTRPRAE
jgi:GT2 family glycosyltransferase